MAIEGQDHVALEPPDLARLLARGSAVRAGFRAAPIRQAAGNHSDYSNQLSEFLFRTLHEKSGRRPYPSGGACYPLKAYIGVHQCSGVSPGLYAYSPTRHELVRVSEPEPRLDSLLSDAAAAAGVERPPQILIVLAARFSRTQRVYGNSSYSLILKEVGAVFQAAMMAAAAMGLATCPLGCGNSLQFSDLAGVEPLTETSVGEMMVGATTTTSDCLVTSAPLEWRGALPYVPPRRRVLKAPPYNQQMRLDGPEGPSLHGNGSHRTRPGVARPDRTYAALTVRSRRRTRSSVEWGCRTSRSRVT